MSGVAQSYGEADELLRIYIALRKLGCVNKVGSPPDSKNETKSKRSALDCMLFPGTFLLKQLNGRLDNLSELAGDICNDLFKQVGGDISPRTRATDEQNARVAVDVFDEQKRYPEFDEYFHACLYQLYDFIMGLDWHETNVVRGLNQSDSNYVRQNLEHINQLIAFQQNMDELIKTQRNHLSPASGSITAGPPPQATPARKSNISSPEGRRSPQARRRVRFDNLPSSSDGADNDRIEHDYRMEHQNSLSDNHSVFALDLLLFGIEVYVQSLADSLAVWSSGVYDDLDQQIGSLFESKMRIRSRQLQIIAKKVKIYNDVHLTVLDHLSEIKRAYLVKGIRGTLLARDSVPLVENYKGPRVSAYLRHLGNGIEIRILNLLTSQCLQILFNLIVCEINAPPIEVKTPKLSQEENVMNFMSSWLRIDDILFGVSTQKKPRSPERERSVSSHTKKIKQPQIVAKTSTLSLNDDYKSSSRILAQMDNLSEFTREFLLTILSRLRHVQQLRYFLESISRGMSQFFDRIATKLEQQLESPSPAGFDSMAAKVRCLKFVHIISSSTDIILLEARRFRIDLKTDPGLDKKLARIKSLGSG